MNALLLPLRAGLLAAAVLGTLVVAPSAQAADAAPLPIQGKTLRLGAGDVLRVSVFQNAELGLETRVDGDGRMTYPFLGAIQAQGKTTAELEKMIAEGLEANGLLKRPQVSVSLLQYRSQQISVLGYVNRPGNYTLDLAYTVAGALALAGGSASQVGADSVVLSRLDAKGQVRNTEIDMVEMFRPGATQRGDIELEGGDVLFVHRAPLFYIYGDVQRPGSQRLERGMTLQQALSASGGLNTRGSLKGVRITRREANGNLSEMNDVDLQAPLRADDVIFIRESLF
ncbi:MAG: polysaccharide export protein EpsE [Pseudomonadota bacterium]|jgi:polysaccharide export outer membrane protein